jgi:hypothetical protein
MRPSIGKLITKLKKLDALGEHPDAVTYVNEALARHYFVHERLRPADAFENFMAAYRVWLAAMNYPSHLEDVRNDRQLEMVQNAITGDDVLKSQSLGTRLREHLDGPDDEPLPSVVGKKVKIKVRNNQSPGPSHKSPIAFKGTNIGSGFTIPGVPGKFIWHASDVGDKPPDLDAVVDIFAAGLASVGEARRSPDLKDKKLMKQVRQIIWSHTYDTNYEPICSCGAEFPIGEDWAVHVRKLIWKELKG